MSSVDTDTQQSKPSVFLSYASGDRVVARTVRDALANFGLEVWYDESDLGGGELWDQKIRRQIRECDYFMPLISAQTEARAEGYFRREWRLAVERTLDMADDHAFLLPVVIDDTSQSGARVPEKFLTAQWLRVPGGQATPALEVLCRRIAAGQLIGSQPGRKPADRPTASGSPDASIPPAPAVSYPAFPSEEPGLRTRHWFHVLGWLLRCVWITFKRWPKWIRILVYLWIVVIFLSRGGCTPRHRETPPLPPATADKLKSIADKYQGSTKPEDLKILGSEIAQQFSTDAKEREEAHSPLLAIPFTAPEGDTEGAKLAEATFAMVYGRVVLSHQGRVSLSKERLHSADIGAALKRGLARHSDYVLFGTVDTVAAPPVLTIKIADVSDGSVVWSKSYAAGTDPTAIAAEVDTNVPALEED